LDLSHTILLLSILCIIFILNLLIVNHILIIHHIFDLLIIQLLFLLLCNWCMVIRICIHGFMFSCQIIDCLVFSCLGKMLCKMGILFCFFGWILMCRGGKIFFMRRLELRVTMIQLIKLFGVLFIVSWLGHFILTLPIHVFIAVKFGLVRFLSIIQ
jgi:hypothetical protein